jgi:predicted TIM-barrel fold metal-dependent hydrolase
VIIDTQVHDPAPGAPWEFGEESRPVLACEAILAAMDAIGVDAAVLAPRHDVTFAEVGAVRYPERLARVIMIDHRDPGVDERVAGLLDIPGVVALRQVVVDYANNRADELRAGAYEPVFAAAERHAVPVFVLGPGFPGDLVDTARAHPDLVMIVDHLGLRQYPPLSMDPDPWEKLPGLLALAEFPNVYVKVCGVQLLSDEPYPHDDVWPNLSKVFDAFGPDRLMWASDMTRLRMVPPGEPWRGTYGDALTMFRDTDRLSDGDKELLLGGTARRVLGWPSAQE